MEAPRPTVCKGCGAPIVQPPVGKRVWCSERCRKGQYAGECVDCGGPTDGSNGKTGVPERCRECSREHQTQYERNARMVEMFNAGASYLEIGDELGLAQTDVGSRLSDLRQRGELTTRRYRVKRSAWPTVKRMLADDQPTSAIARHLDTSTQNVRMMIKSMRRAGELD